jgi:O-antigen/teichoic acid export membrane protein
LEVAFLRSSFGERPGVVRTISISLVNVIGGEASVRAANFVAALFVARVYGSSMLGAYAACFAAVTVVILFADNGLQTSAITELTSAVNDRGRTLGGLSS